MDNTISGNFNSDSNYLYGGEGNDYLAGYDVFLYRFLYVPPGDTFSNDLLDGGADDDTLEGGPGNDSLYPAQVMTP